MPKKVTQAVSNVPGTLLPPEETPPAPTLRPSSMARIKKAATEILKRRCEALLLYEPLPPAELFHASHAPERLCFGSNRSGKTTAALFELVRAATGHDPYNKYPKRDGRAYVVGKDTRVLSEAIWRKLCR